MTLNITNPGFPPPGIAWDATNGYLEIGLNSPQGKVHACSTSAAVCFLADKISTDNAGPQFSYKKARGSIGALAAVASGDVLFNIGGFGHDGTGYGSAASCSIRARADEAFTTIAHGTYFFISTCNIGSATQTEKVRITSNGSFNIGASPATTSTSKLNILGLPTSAAGLNTGDVWVDITGGLNILKIV